MIETQVGFLFKAASCLQQAGDSKSLSFLRSYYLMRCKDITNGYGLPDKHFSSKVRCSKCCIEWRKNVMTKTKALKLSKKQRRRIRAQKANKLNKDQVQKRIELLNSNEIEQLCSFCKQSTVTRVLKPQKVIPNPTPIKTNNILKKIAEPQKEITAKNKEVKADTHKKNITQNLMKSTKKTEVNVYSTTTEVFSLNNNKNSLTNNNAEGKKIIKNKKKNIDKFAGLCQKAVLASAKLKEEKKQNKIDLFLKPSIS